MLMRRMAGGTNNAQFLYATRRAEWQDADVPMERQSSKRWRMLIMASFAMEFGHGISNRLTGGPSQSGCLSNAETNG
jgi:hypothetical protein